MNSGLFNSVKEQYIKAFAEEKVAELLVRSLSFISPNTLRNQASMEAQKELEHIQRKLISGFKLIKQKVSMLSIGDQEVIQLNLEKVMQSLGSLTCLEEIKSTTDTWGSASRSLSLSNDFYDLLRLIGVQVENDKRYEEAADIFLIVVLLFPFKAEGWMQLGEIEQKLGHFEKCQDNVCTGYFN